jgi:hypothetical protein
MGGPAIIVATGALPEYGGATQGVQMLLRFVDEVSPGIARYKLDLDELYPDGKGRARSEARWPEFVASTADHGGLFAREADSIVYRTESFLPREDDGRTPVLLVLGNPASHSVRAGMCFAFEKGHGTEHRFWQALAAAKWLSFSDALGTPEEDGEVRNARRRADLLAGRYESPFLVGIDLFFTFPSPASAPVWAGVSGLVKLFGRPAIRLIAAAERTRLAATISRYVTGQGVVVAFQRDAYEGLRDQLAPPYTLADARGGRLQSDSAAGCPVRLFGAPPTRMAHTQMFRRVLVEYAETIAGT